MDRPVVNEESSTKPALKTRFNSATIIAPNTQAIATAAVTNHDNSETVGTPLSPHAQSDFSGATRLKRMVQESPNIIVCPGVYDGFSASTLCTW